MTYHLIYQNPYSHNMEHEDESFWTGDNKLEYFTTKANFDGDNALVPFHVIKKKKYENNNR